MGIKVEHLKEWLSEVVDEERADAEGSQGIDGKEDKWRMFVKLIQTVWNTGSIPPQMLWMSVVLLPKGGGDYRGIGLLEPFWKAIEILMVQSLQVVQFHDCLHGFLKGRGTGTATIEAKLAQQLAYLEQQPFYEVFIDLCKAYDAIGRDRCLDILRGYGVGYKMFRLIKFFWDNAELVCRANGYFGEPFKAH